jgi:diguanylate cyclase (GGDEF)-like protein
MPARLREHADRLRERAPVRAFFSAAGGLAVLSARAVRILAGITAVAIVAAAALGARALANHDAATARSDFANVSRRVAPTVSLALAREEDLVVAASTFIAGRPSASSGEISAWTSFARVAAGYPEVRRLDVIRREQIPPAGSPTSPLGAGATSLSASLSRAPATTTLSGAPATALAPGASRSVIEQRVTRCVLVGGLAGAARVSAASKDLCARNPALLASRDSGRAAYRKASVHRRAGLEIDTPVYHGAGVPAGVGARRASFAGWLRLVVEPGTLLDRALAGAPGVALRLRHRGTFGATFATATTASLSSKGAQSATFGLHGWTLETIGPRADATVFGNWDSAALLIGGTLFGILLSGCALLASESARPLLRTREDGEGKRKPDELYDRLTGLPNRALTLDRAERMIARGGRESGVLAGGLLIDIDWFADINERFGSNAGDKVLCAVAQRLKATMRAVDSIGRMGGDEFVVLVEASRGVKFDAVACRVIEALHEPIDVEGFGPSFVITASIGVAFGRYRSVEDLLADARLALVSAKSAGKDRYTLFNANMRSVVEGRGVLEGELNAALSERQLFLMYEPIRDLRTHAVVGLEAHVQWRHPEKGVMPADEFMSLAEDSGLEVPIGRFALEAACTHGAAWNLSEHRVAVAVKVSGTQLQREGFLTDVRRALQLSGLEPALLTLEIEETTLIDDLEASRSRLAQLRLLGVSIAIDEFGNGYAFRSDFQNMPIDCIKVDRESLARSEGDDYRNWLLEAILSFGRDLSMNVIATAVRSPPQLGVLQAMGFPMAQGPAVGEAVPAEAVRGLLDAPPPAQDDGGMPAAPNPPVMLAGAVAPGVSVDVQATPPALTAPTAPAPGAPTPAPPAQGAQPTAGAPSQSAAPAQAPPPGAPPAPGAPVAAAPDSAS